MKNYIHILPLAGTMIFLGGCIYGYMYIWLPWHLFSLYFFPASVLTWLTYTAKNKFANLIFVNLFILLLFMFLVELWLRFADGRYKTYFERNLGWFFTEQHGSRLAMSRLKEGDVLYLNPPPTSVYSLPQDEFSYSYQTDGLGLNNKANKAILGKRDSSSLTLAIGDSFTFGLGAPPDSSWPEQLSRLSGKTIINAGTVGGDPIYSYWAYRQIYKDMFKVGHIILMITPSDVDDVMVRGGAERYQTLEPRLADPWWIPLYAGSMLFRAFLHHSEILDPNFLLPPDEMNRMRIEACTQIAAVLKNWQHDCVKDSIRFTVVFMPGLHNIQLKKWETLEPLVANLANSEIQHVDLLNIYLRNMKKFGDPEHFYWPIDRHCNSDGYRGFTLEIGKALGFL